MDISISQSHHEAIGTSLFMIHGVQVEADRNVLRARRLSTPSDAGWVFDKEIWPSYLDYRSHTLMLTFPDPGPCASIMFPRPELLFNTTDGTTTTEEMADQVIQAITEVEERSTVLYDHDLI